MVVVGVAVSSKAADGRAANRVAVVGVVGISRVVDSRVDSSRRV